MCGRYALGYDAQQIRLGVHEYFGRLRGGGAGGVNPAADAPADEGGEAPAPADAAGPSDGPFSTPGGAEDSASSIIWKGEDRFKEKNWNVAPRSGGVVLRMNQRGSEGKENGGKGDGGGLVEGELFLQTMQWGLIPHWSKHPPQGPLNTINARSENLTDQSGGMWQSLKGPKRCIAIVEGYYEWQKKGTTKIPHFTRLPPSKTPTPNLMYIAALYDTVTYQPSPSDPSPTPHSTFTILTTTPSERLKFLHDRMPVILGSKEDALVWLDCEEGWTGRVAGLCKPYEGELECYPVQSEVGKVGTNSSSYILPVAERKDGIANFFKKQEEKGISIKGSPEKPKAGAKTEAPDAKPGTKGKGKETVHHPVTSGSTSKSKAKKEEATELKDDGLDAGIGDDSNAPNPDVKLRKGQKRKQEKVSDDEIQIVEEAEHKEAVRTTPKRRRKVEKVEEGRKKGQSSIEAFLK